MRNFREWVYPKADLKLKACEKDKQTEKVLREQFSTLDLLLDETLEAMHRQDDETTATKSKDTY